MDTAAPAPPAGANRLLFEQSPYLLQHAHNPVDWYPWGEAAFARAREEDKPIFLSIGYSTCHWCHVMERESFEDGQVARLLNASFVCVKVDREERPDVDSVYMTACQALTGSGGWPLTIVMTPDKRPFFAATYLPKDTRFGRLGLLQLLPRLAAFWAEDRAEAVRHAGEIAAALREATAAGSAGELGPQTLTRAYQALAGAFDPRRGGFSSAPKFPLPHNLMFLLRYWRRSGETRALAMVEQTLRAMRAGGLFDQLGFGFHRYCTDAQWLVPHFEKMLYDQALLIMAYAEAYQATGREEYRQTAEETIAYVRRALTSPEGAFYSAEDADSEGVEGKFYLWTEAEIREVLAEEDAVLVLAAYGVAAEGNFRDEASGEPSAANILHLPRPIEQTASEAGLAPETVRARLEEARGRLLQRREQRVRPALDDKILADWNGLMIAALARAAQAFDEPRYAQAAERAAQFLLGALRTGDGRLLHRYRDGHAGLTACLDDYAFLAWGLIDLYEATFTPAHLRAALELTEQMLQHHWDAQDGGLTLSPVDGEELLLNPKEVYDGALPSGNSVALLNLLRLARLTGRTDLETRAAALQAALGGRVGAAPAAHTLFLAGLDFALGPAAEVVVVGAPEAEDTAAMLRALRRPFLPSKVVLLRPAGEPAPEIAALAEHVRDHGALDGRATAYVCHDFRCEAPTTDPQQMLRHLGAASD